MKLINIPFLHPVGFAPYAWHYCRTTKDIHDNDVIYIHRWLPRKRIYIITMYVNYTEHVTKIITLPPVTLTYFTLRYD